MHYGVATPGLARHALRSILGAPQILRHYATCRSGRPPEVFGIDMMAEQAPTMSSRVRLARRRDRLGVPMTVLDWRLTSMDWDSIRRTVEIFGDAVREAGVGTVISTLGSEASAGGLRQLAPPRYDTDAPRPRSRSRGRELSSTRDDQPLHRRRVGLSHRRLCQPVAYYRRALPSAGRSPQIDATSVPGCRRASSSLPWPPIRAGAAHRTDGVLEFIDHPDDASCTNRRLSFEAELVPYCGEAYRVKNEGLEKFVRRQTDCAICAPPPSCWKASIVSRAIAASGCFCPRSIYSLEPEVAFKFAFPGTAPTPPASFLMIFSGPSVIVGLLFYAVSMLMWLNALRKWSCHRRISHGRRLRFDDARGCPCSIRYLLSG